MSTTEILEELPRLAREEREKIWKRLEEIELGQMEETPEMLAAIDEGRRAIAEGKTVNFEEVRRRIRQWTTTT
jgi:predicted transcriptional regulator